MAETQTTRYSLTLIFEPNFENCNETTQVAYQSYVARFITLDSIRGYGRTVIRGMVAALTGAVVLVSTVGEVEAYSVKRSSRGDLVHWDERTVSYTIDPSVDTNVAHAGAATLHAMDSWSGTVGAPELKSATLDDASPTAPGLDQKNGIFFVKGGYSPAGRALAITVLTYDNTSGTILDADVIFNGSYVFEVLKTANNPDFMADPLEEGTTTHPSAAMDGLTHAGGTVTVSTTETVYDLHHVIAHELGHSLGMNDETLRKDALMYRYSAPNDATIRQPASDDIAGLAEIYSTKLEAGGNGCGSATVSPKKPTTTSSLAATVATLGLLFFLVVRAKSDKRARIGFVLAVAMVAVALVPSLSGKQGSGVAKASERRLALGHARAKVLGTSTSIESGLFKTAYKLATTECRVAACPSKGHGVVWGGTIGNITQEVGGYYAPVDGDDVDVSFEKLPSAIGPLANPLAGRQLALTDENVAVSVLTLKQ